MGIQKWEYCFMIKIEDWILEDIRRIRKIPQHDRSPYENGYLSLLWEYNNMVSEFNAKMRKLK